jgi:two-component SAPR family response regulator
VPATSLPDKPLIVSIDDETNILKLVRHMLEPLYTVMTFADTEQALQALKKLRPDLIICDINMPNLDGFALHTLLRGNDPLRSVPFIYLTALADRETFRKGMLQGADDYLVKPFTAIELREAVEARLERTQTLREQSSQETAWFVTSLGGAVIEADGKMRDFHENKKSLELFLYLFSKSHTVLQEDIVRELWWEAVEANTLHVLLNRARKTFEGLAEFTVRGDQVLLKVLRSCVWDAEQFENNAKQALSNQDETLIEKLLQSSKGDFLVGFESPWSEEQRDHFEGLYLQLLEASLEVAKSEAQHAHALHRLQTYLGVTGKRKSE